MMQNFLKTVAINVNIRDDITSISDMDVYKCRNAQMLFLNEMTVMDLKMRLSADCT